MNYRPSPSRLLWDTWVFPWQGQYHLFYAETQKHLWDHVGRAVSDDLIHWTPLESIQMCSPTNPDWPGDFGLTGTTVHHNEQFYVFVGAHANNCQTQRCFVSEDMQTWRLHPTDPVMKATPPYMTSLPDQPADWRDPRIIQDDEGIYHAYLCARMHPQNPDDSGAAVAHLTSTDLLHWEAQPPLVEIGETFFHTEVPDVFELDGRWYLCFSSISKGGTQIDTPSRKAASGTFYMIAEHRDGPFTLPDDPLLIGEGRRKVASYVARTIPTDQGQVLCHHIQSEKPALGLPKRLQTDPATGTLSLHYMPVVQTLQTGTLCTAIDDDMPKRAQHRLGHWAASDGTLTGRANAAGGNCTLLREFVNGEINCRITASTAAQSGLVIRTNHIRLVVDRGIGVALDFASQRMILTMVERDPDLGWGACESTVLRGKGFPLHETCNLPLNRNQEYHLRCLVRDEFIEVYLDDRWVFTSVFPNEMPAGDIEAWTQRGETTFSHLNVATWDSLQDGR